MEGGLDDSLRLVSVCLPPAAPRRGRRRPGEGACDPLTTVRRRDDDGDGHRDAVRRRHRVLASGGLRRDGRRRRLRRRRRPRGAVLAHDGPLELVDESRVELVEGRLRPRGGGLGRRRRRRLAGRLQRRPRRRPGEVPARGHGHGHGGAVVRGRRDAHHEVAARRRGQARALGLGALADLARAWTRLRVRTLGAATRPRRLVDVPVVLDHGHHERHGCVAVLDCWITTRHDTHLHTCTTLCGLSARSLSPPLSIYTATATRGAIGREPRDVGPTPSYVTRPVMAQGTGAAKRCCNTRHVGN